MGVYLEHFFNYPKEINELIGDLTDNLWTHPWREEDGTYWGVILGITFWITKREGFLNDRDMDFESYDYYIATKLVYRPAMFHHTQLTVMLSVIYMLYERMDIKEGMLVWDEQRLLSKYEERDDALYNLVSQTPFTNFAEHMKAIEVRMPEEWRS